MQPKLSNSQQGFSLIELMLVVLILMIITGAVMESIRSAQTRSRIEEAKVDTTQSVREFVEQIVRDVHMSGYPKVNMFAAGVLMNPEANDARVANGHSNPMQDPHGLVAISARDLWFETDVDEDGTVDSIRYQLQTDAAGNCPCILARSQMPKMNGVAPSAQAPTFRTGVDNVLNSGSGAGALALSGSMNYQGTIRTNDTVYTAWKGEPVFRYYDSRGVEIAVPANLVGGNLGTASNNALLNRVRSVRVTLNVFTPITDLDTRMRPPVVMSAAARVNN